MEPVVAVYDNYRRELEEGWEGLRLRSLDTIGTTTNLLNETQAQIEPKKQQLVEAITDTSDVVTPALPVLDTFGWSSVLLASLCLGSVLGSFLVGPVLGLFLGKAGSALFAFAIIPVYSYFFVKQRLESSATDVEVRFGLLTLAFSQGVFSGHALSSLYLSAQPLPVLTPAAIAVAFPLLVSSLGASRVALLASSMAAAVGVNLLLGLVAGYLTAPYLLLTVLYAGAAGLVLQLLFKHVQAPEIRVHMYQLAVLTSFVLLKAAVFGLFGSASYVDASTSGDSTLSTLSAPVSETPAAVPENQ